ncbi:MAG: N-acetylmuramoyl-L-alanine amidase [candidate division Zixibacteria bacterium]|nr:N-acetylmuramoyl-L-alanine amidase [candidate division Zixibacteria bacterium]
MKIVVLDAGHGGKFDGCKSLPPRSKTEKNLVMDITWFVAEELLKTDILPVLTRTDDYHLNTVLERDLLSRAKTANRFKADIFVSIHANSTGKSSDNAMGFEVWHYPDSAKGLKLAKSIIDSMAQTLPERRNRGVKPSSNPVEIVKAKTLLVLSKTNMPAVIVETGFLNNTEEDIWLHDNKQRIAMSIADGINNYYI